VQEKTYHVEWLEDGKILCVRFISTGSETAEAWFKEGQELLGNWSPDKPLLMMYDMRHVRNLMSAEAIQTTQALARINKDRVGKAAILLHESAPAQNITATAKYAIPTNYTIKMFKDEPEAVAWLLEQ
jgi:hypothetical protein